MNPLYHGAIVYLNDHGMSRYGRQSEGNYGIVTSRSNFHDWVEVKWANQYHESYPNNTLGLVEPGDAHKYFRTLEDTDYRIVDVRNNDHIMRTIKRGYTVEQLYIDGHIEDIMIAKVMYPDHSTKYDALRQKWEKINNNL